MTGYDGTRRGHDAEGRDDDENGRVGQVGEGVDDPRTLVIRSPEELVASIPAMLGFLPAPGSMVLVCGETADGRQGPVARLDVHGMLGLEVGDPFEDEIGVVDEGPARGIAAFCAREGVRSVHLVVVHEGCADSLLAEREAADAVDVFEHHLGMAGTTVVRAYGVGEFAEGARWVELDGMARGFQVDPDSCELAAVYAFDGRVRASSRGEIEELYRSRDHDACTVDTTPAGAVVLPGRHAVARALEVHDAAARFMGAGEDPDDDLLAEIGFALRDVALRDAIYSRLAATGLAEDDGRRHLWWALARRRPPRERSVALLLLGAAAYFGGRGVHARAALEEALVADPGNALAGLLVEGLDRGVPPERIRMAVAS